MKIPAFDLYLFDLDGTLLDSAEDICGAVQQVLTPHVEEPVAFERLRRLIGFHLDDMLLDVRSDFTRDQLDEMIREYRSVYPERGHASTRVFPGVVETLSALGGLKSTATTKGTSTTRDVLEKFGLLRYFDHVQGTDGFPCKPAPDVLEKSLEHFNIEPARCLFIGDSEADMEAGRRAGVKLCAVDYGYGDAQKIAQHQPDYSISDLRQLLQ